MHASVRFDPDSGQVRLDSQADDRDLTENYAAVPVHFTVPPGWVFEATHPDLLALVAILCVHPFVGERLTLDLAVSDEFRGACLRALPYECVFAASAAPVPPRPPGSVPGLAFSGGVDSTAALAVMPQNTVVFFLDRTPELSGARGLYVKDSAEVACRMIADHGYTVHMIDTNLERIRRPVGFPVDWSNGAPAVLLADYCGLSSISWGMVAESGFRVGHERFLDFGARTIFVRWDRLLRAVGLCLGAPVAGLSEVGTSMIALRSSLVGVAQSCIRGAKDQPCMNCAKCFRKKMLDSALAGEAMDIKVFDRMVRFRGGEKIVLGLPVKHENVYRWTIEHLTMSGTSPTWKAFTRRLRTPVRDVSWAGAWYPPSADFVPAEFRESAIAQILQFVPAQTESQQRDFESWDLRDDLASADVKIAVDELDRALQQNKADAAAARARAKAPPAAAAPAPKTQEPAAAAPRTPGRRLLAAGGTLVALILLGALRRRPK